uniref:Tachykinin receptor 1 n=1 Tax=Petromyzon marinus TaxID=7757 RepID=S4R5E9_PETMA
SLSLPRYMAIIHPLRPRLSAFATKVLIGVIWLLAVVLAFPFFYFSEVADSHGRFICYISFPKDDHSKIYESQLQPLHLLLTPLKIEGTPTEISVGNTFVLLSGQRQPGYCCDLKMHYTIRTTSEVVKMMIVVVCTFAICWLPYHVYFLVYEIDSELFQWKYIQQVYLAVFWLAMSCSMYNPIIYCCLNNSRIPSHSCRGFFWSPFYGPKKYDRL